MLVTASLDRLPKFTICDACDQSPLGFNKLLILVVTWILAKAAKRAFAKLIDTLNFSDEVTPQVNPLENRQISISGVDIPN